MTQNEIRGDGLDGLNDLQQKALLAEGHCAVLAGPRQWQDQGAYQQGGTSAAPPSSRAKGRRLYHL